MMRHGDIQLQPTRNTTLHGSRAQRFWGGYGWLYLAASLSIHAIILCLLPVPTLYALAPKQDILITLEAPPPMPLPEPDLEPRQNVKPTPMPQSTAEPQAEFTQSPAPIISGDTESPETTHTGKVVAPIPKLELEPAREIEPLPIPPEPEVYPEPAADIQALLMEYAGSVKARVLSRKYYPEVAERLGHTGNVKVGFTIAADGELASVSIKSSSGWDDLDAAATEAVRSAAPFDPIPAETLRDQLSLSITLRYTLD